MGLKAGLSSRSALALKAIITYMYNLLIGRFYLNSLLCRNLPCRLPYKKEFKKLYPG